MIVIYPGQDIIMAVEFDETIDTFDLSFFTSNPEVCVQRTKSDLKEGNLIKINSSELENLNTGELKCRVHMQTEDMDFNDDEYDEIQIINTNYYIKK